MPDANAPVAVTGGSGYLGSWVIEVLLSQGYTVHATVRDPSNAARVQHLRDLAEQRPGTLTLFAADLMKDGGFEAAFEGCAAVMHTASPFQTAGIRDPQRMLVDPALRGTERVLAAVDACPTVTRVVLTSSVAAMYSDADELDETPEGVFAPSRWNSRSSLAHNPYSYSKTVAERRAWALCEQQDRWTMTTINPAFIVGPPLSGRRDSTSVNLIRMMAKGMMFAGAPDLTFGVVDVRDVARAHLRALAADTDGARVILCRDAMGMLEIAAEIERAFPGTFRLPTRTLPKWVVWLFGPLQGADRSFVKHNVGFKVAFDNSLSRSLGVEYTPPGDTFRDMIDAMRTQGLL